MNRGKKRAAADDAVAIRKERLAEEEAAAKQLEEKHKLAKFFGLTFAKKINDNSLAKALHRWKQCIFKDKTSTLREELDKLSANMKELIMSNDDLEEKNAALAGENEELRQLSLESVDLAKSMKELNRQKQQLSVDLADRAATIRKLLEDNRILNEKLALAQKEAAAGFGIVTKKLYSAEKEQQ